MMEWQPRLMKRLFSNNLSKSLFDFRLNFFSEVVYQTNRKTLIQGMRRLHMYTSEEGRKNFRKVS